MQLKDFELFKQKYSINCKTKSENYSVLSLYSFILQHENSDSDFWNISAGNGFGDIDYILNNFDENDWNKLTEDVTNWTTYQKEILSEGLLTVNYYKNHFNQSEITNVEKRFEILPLLIKIADTNNEIYDNIGDFIKIYFPVIDTKNLKIVESITEIKKWDDKILLNSKNIECTKTENTEIINNMYNKVCC